MARCLVLAAAAAATALAATAQQPSPSPSPSPSPPATLRCQSSSGAASMQMTLDYSSFVPGSGLFVPTRASITDNYRSADLVCIGSSFKQGAVHCVGYQNGGRDTIMDVTIEKGADAAKNSLVHASYTFLRSPSGDPSPQTPGPWPCEVTASPPPFWGPVAAPPPPPGHLRCQASSGAADLSLTLDYANYSPGSGYFSTEDACIMDNYNMGDLRCIGNTLTEPSDGGPVISCLGYNNGMATEIFEANVDGASAGTKWPEGMLAQASYTFVKSDRGPDPQTPGPWPCAVTAPDGGEH